MTERPEGGDHLSGLLVRPMMAAGPDGVRWSGPFQSGELEAPTAPRVVPAVAAAFRSTSSFPVAPLQFDASYVCAPRLVSIHNRGLINFAARNDGPDDPGGLVGHVHGDQSGWLAFEEAADPIGSGGIGGPGAANPELPRRRAASSDSGLPSAKSAPAGLCRPMSSGARPAPGKQKTPGQTGTGRGPSRKPPALLR